MLTGYYQKKKQRTASKKSLVKGIKIFLKKKKARKRQYAPEPYRNLSEEERIKKRQYGLERRRYLSAVETQKLVEYRKNYSRM